MKEQLVWTTDYTNVLYADIVIGTTVILLGLIMWRNTTWRWPLLGCGVIYCVSTLLWHTS